MVTLVASDDVNGNSPVAVDVVLVTDDALVDRLTALPASKWFDGRADLVASFPKGLRYQSWELVPGQRLDVSGDTFDGTRVAGAFVFANYPQAGAHRVRIQQFSGTLVVQLDVKTKSLFGERHTTSSVDLRPGRAMRILRDDVWIPLDAKPVVVSFADRWVIDADGALYWVPRVND